MIFLRVPPLLLLLSLFATAVPGATSFFPLSEVHAGLKGVGRTVFQGDKIEEFQVEIYGVLPNAGPKESVILARLSGGPLEHTGVLQGMSGSPVYIDGRLLGAVAMAFPFSKDPVAAIRPIEDMVRSERLGDERHAPDSQKLALALEKHDLSALLPQTGPSPSTRLMNISTPLTLGGFTVRTIDAFATQLRALGLEPSQALSAGGGSTRSATAAFGDPSSVRPGSMISVQLMEGDMNVGADGTVTYVEGDRLYAFGHRFLGLGRTGLPFAKSEVLTLLANLNTSFKISSPHELMGLISQDRDTAVSGKFGERANMVPLAISLRRNGKVVDTYHMNMVNDPMFTPLLLQMAVFSTLDSTERTSGPTTISVRGKIDLNGNRSIPVSDMFAGDSSVPQLASLATAAPVAYVMQSGLDSLSVQGISLDIEAIEKKRTVEIEEIVPARRQVKPGDTINLHVTLTADNGGDEIKTVQYRVPIGAEPGPLYFTVADGNQTGMQELKVALASTPRTPEQLLSLLSRLRDNSKAYVRVWRPEPSFPAGVDELPAAPPSVALVMASSLGKAGIALNAIRNSKVVEMTIDGDGRTVTGSKTVLVEIQQ